jgi:hypothetical protein
MGLLKAACAEGGTRIRSFLVKVAPGEYDGVLREYEGVLGGHDGVLHGWAAATALSPGV